MEAAGEDARLVWNDVVDIVEKESIEEARERYFSRGSEKMSCFCSYGSSTRIGPSGWDSSRKWGVAPRTWPSFFVVRNSCARWCAVSAFTVGGGGGNAIFVLDILRTVLASSKMVSKGFSAVLRREGDQELQRPVADPRPTLAVYTYYPEQKTILIAPGWISLDQLSSKGGEALHVEPNKMSRDKKKVVWFRMAYC